MIKTASLRFALAKSIAHTIMQSDYSSSRRQPLLVQSINQSFVQSLHVSLSEANLDLMFSSVATSRLRVAISAGGPIKNSTRLEDHR